MREPVTLKRSVLTSPFLNAAFCAIAVLVLGALFTSAQGQPPADAPAPGIALVSALGPRFQMVERRAPGAVWFSYRREMVTVAGEDSDAAALRGLEAALYRAKPRVNTARVALPIEPSALWRWRGTSDSPLKNTLDRLAAMPERAAWQEILLVVPLLEPQPGGVPPIRRGVGIFADPAAAADRYSLQVSIRVWRISARSLAPIASEDVIKSVPVGDVPGALTSAPAREVAWSRLRDLIETSVEAAALRLLQAQAGTERGRAGEPQFPSIEVSARRFTCPALQWRWYDAIASAYEQRNFGSNPLIPTRFDEALHSAAAISQEAVARGCLVRITADCAEDRVEEQRAVADSGDSWQERDVPEELQARGVTPEFVARQFPYFGHPERCRP